MVALFGGHGYAVMSADLVGLGAGTGRNPECYMMKKVSTQANHPAVYTEMKGIDERTYGDIQNLLSLLKSWENKEKTSFL